jgi:hypothetical protein
MTLVGNDGNEFDRTEKIADKTAVISILSESASQEFIRLISECIPQTGLEFLYEYAGSEPPPDQEMILKYREILDNLTTYPAVQRYAKQYKKDPEFLVKAIVLMLYSKM